MAQGWKATIDGFKKIRSKNANKIAGYGLTLPGAPRGVIPDLIRFPVLIADADTKRKILENSEKMGLGISNGYPDSIDGIHELGNVSDGKGFPGAKDSAARVVSLPVHPFVNERDLEKCVQQLL
jgi:dTDP-4-amino-4,6-dideoxygalactose transaminase